MVAWSFALHLDPMRPGIQRVSLHGRDGDRHCHIGLILPMPRGEKEHAIVCQDIRLICEHLEAIGAVGGQAWSGAELLTFPEHEG